MKLKKKTFGEKIRILFASTRGFGLTGVFAALAGRQCRHVLLEQERGRRVIVILDRRQPLVRFVVHGRVVAVLGLVADVAATGSADAATDQSAAAAVERGRADGGFGDV